MKQKTDTVLLKHFPIIVTCLLVVIAIFFHPSINSKLWHPYRQSLFNTYIINISTEQPLSAADHWYFREFYSRGKITLSKYDPEKARLASKNVLSVSLAFEPYLLFESDKITSVEGPIDPQIVPLLINSAVFETYETITSSLFYRLTINRTTNQALLITIYTLEDAALANGYLSFDLRNEEYKNSVATKHWVMITRIDLD